MLGQIGAVAQLGEHLHGMQGVGSSNLLCSTIFLRQIKKMADAATSVMTRQGA
jgi:hypothetical protein